MYAKCIDTWDNTAIRAACTSVAEGMYNLVDQFGQGAFDASPRGHC